MGEIREACGIFGIYGPGEDVATLVYFGILALQHRGQESAGIATSDSQLIRLEKQAGRVDRFMPEQIAKLSGSAVRPAISGIGHTRYSNTGSNLYENFQPIVVLTRFGQIALAHNGNLISPTVLRQRLIARDLMPAGTSDSELIALSIAEKSFVSDSIEEAIQSALQEITGAYSLVILTNRKLIGVRDPWGIRPLSVGRIKKNHFLLTSETCTSTSLGAEPPVELEPGEMAVIEADQCQVSQLLPQKAKRLCIFEFIYFASPGSIMYDRLLQTARRHMGEQLFQEHPVKIDDPEEWIVCGIPDTGIPAAEGYAESAGLQLRSGFLKNRYIGRTFIVPDQHLRSIGVRAKLMPLGREVFKKKVVMVEDSIVRGTTTGQAVGLLREAGACEVHIRVTSPPYKFRCLMGIDTQNSDELIASRKSIEEIRQAIGADSLGYLSLEGVISAINKEKYLEPIPDDHFCPACFDGHYPFEIPEVQDRFVLERT